MKKPKKNYVIVPERERERENDNDDKNLQMNLNPFGASFPIRHV